MSQSISQKFTPVSLLKFALPSMVMMVFYVMLYPLWMEFSFQDILAVRQSFAANIVYPFSNPLLAVGIMFATGGSAIASVKTGEGKRRVMEDFISLQSE